MGYQVVELRAIDNLIRNQNSLEIQISVLLWLIKCTQSELVGKGIELEVIKVEYLGAYPAIGIKYLSQDVPDLESFIVERCEHVLNTFTVENLLQFISENSKYIKDFTGNF
jgi:hypothetical protein